MPDSIAPPTVAGQAPEPVTPLVGDPQQTPPPASGDPALTPEQYQRMIADLRKESAAHRTKLAAFEKAQADAAAAQLSDIEKATRRAETAEAEKTALAAKHQQTILHLAMLRTANKVGLVTPEAQDAALKLLDVSALELDDDGQPKNMEKALNDLLVKYPFLKPAAAPAPAAPAIPPMNPARSAITTPQQRTGPLSLTDAWRLHEQQKQQTPH